MESHDQCSEIFKLSSLQRLCEVVCPHFVSSTMIYVQIPVLQPILDEEIPYPHMFCSFPARSCIVELKTLGTFIVLLYFFF